MFNEGRTNVHDEERSGRQSLITEDLKNRIDQHIIITNRLSTLDEIHEKFPQIFRSRFLLNLFQFINHPTFDVL
jgi:hypothetical protein